MARWFLAFALLLASSSSFGQDARFSGGMLNGYMWQQMSDAEKTYYTKALLEVSSTLEDSARRPVNLEKCKCTGVRLMEGVDNFYSMAANTNKEWMRLPVLCVFTGENWRLSGEPLEKIGTYYATMLQVIDAVEKPQKPRQ